MEGNTFDRITKTLAAGSSRRRVLGGAVGGAAALITGATLLDAKSRNKRKGKKKRPNGNGNNGGDGGAGDGAGTEKVLICHRNNGRKGYNLIEVGAPAAAAHERHGDTVCETPDDECTVITGCDEDGACTTGPAPEGTSCDVSATAAGACNAEGVCEELEPAPTE